MALTGTEFMYGETITDPADTRRAALHAVSRCAPDELPMVLSILGLDTNYIHVAPTIPFEGTCRNGHTRTATNTHRRKTDGATECITCKRDRNQRYDARKRATA